MSWSVDIKEAGTISITSQSPLSARDHNVFCRQTNYFDLEDSSGMGTRKSVTQIDTKTPVTVRLKPSEPNKDQLEALESQTIINDFKRMRTLALELQSIGTSTQEAAKEFQQLLSTNTTVRVRTSKPVRSSLRSNNEYSRSRSTLSVPGSHRSSSAGILTPSSTDCTPSSSHASSERAESNVGFSSAANEGGRTQSRSSAPTPSASHAPSEQTESDVGSNNARNDGGLTPSRSTSIASSDGGTSGGWIEGGWTPSRSNSVIAGDDWAESSVDWNEDQEAGPETYDGLAGYDEES